VRGSGLIGQLIDRRYKIVERIAEGAMGVVYHGVRTKLDRAVAIKVMHSSLPEAEGRKRFEREAKLMARLEHPHCVSIIDFGIHDNKPFVVMELVRGRSLHDMIVEQGRFEIPRAVDVMRQVLSGLAHAHEQGIIHRDIKPANIMCSPKAPLGLHARLLDFGLARMLGASTSLSDGVAVGTPSYMAPEQCRGDTLDERVDIYACGVVLFEMLTGRKPFVASEPIDIIKKALQEQPPTLADVAPGDYGKLEAVVARALAKRREDRYPSAVAMAEALSSAIGNTSTSESTSEFPLAAMPKEASIEVPITVGSSIRTPKSRDDNSSVIRGMLPQSRMRYFALGAIIVVGGAVAGIVMLKRELTPEKTKPIVIATPPHDAAAIDAPPNPAAEVLANAMQLAANGKVDKALDLLVDARKVYPTRAELPAAAGKLYFSKLWWNDGIANLREAVKLDPKLKNDREIVEVVVRGFIKTPGYDWRIGNFLLELGASAAPLLEDIARTHANPEIRARAEAMRKRLPRT
jgi:serine/threonine-protein kinase